MDQWTGEVIVNVESFSQYIFGVVMFDKMPNSHINVWSSKEFRWTRERKKKKKKTILTVGGSRGSEIYHGEWWKTPVYGDFNNQEIDLTNLDQHGVENTWISSHVSEFPGLDVRPGHHSWFWSTRVITMTVKIWTFTWNKQLHSTQDGVCIVPWDGERPRQEESIRKETIKKLQETDWESGESLRVQWWDNFYFWSIRHLQEEIKWNRIFHNNAEIMDDVRMNEKYIVF